jgi:hypothetical protein
MLWTIISRSAENLTVFVWSILHLNFAVMIAACLFKWIMVIKGSTTPISVRSFSKSEALTRRR